MISFAFTFLMMLPLVICQWLGVVGLAKPHKGGAWWLMVVGAALSTLGIIGNNALTVSSVAGISSPANFGLIFMGIRILGAGGGLAFMMGFALHAWKTRKVWQRIEDLEGIVAAQNEQLGRKDEG